MISLHTLHVYNLLDSSHAAPQSWGSGFSSAGALFFFVVHERSECFN